MQAELGPVGNFVHEKDGSTLVTSGSLGLFLFSFDHPRQFTTVPNGFCQAYSPGTHAGKDEDRLLLEFPIIVLGLVPCNPTRTPAL
jgi:hypothetical protein